MPDRVGQEVLVCYKPRIVAVIDSFDEERRLWQAHAVEPKGMDTPFEFREDFLAYLDSLVIEGQEPDGEFLT